eukprot:3695297-Prymnesium_polylepis.1
MPWHSRRSISGVHELFGAWVTPLFSSRGCGSAPSRPCPWSGRPPIALSPHRGTATSRSS